MAVVDLQWYPVSSHVVVVVVLVPLAPADQLVWYPQPLVPTLLNAPLHVADPAVSLDRRRPHTVFGTLAHGLVNLFGRLRNCISHHVLAPEIS